MQDIMHFHSLARLVEISICCSIFFAYQKAKEDKSVSVYVYVGDLGNGKDGFAKDPLSHELGPYVSMH